MFTSNNNNFNDYNNYYSDPFSDSFMNNDTFNDVNDTFNDGHDVNNDNLSHSFYNQPQNKNQNEDNTEFYLNACQQNNENPNFNDKEFINSNICNYNYLYLNNDVNNYNYSNNIDSSLCQGNNNIQDNNNLQSLPVNDQLTPIHKTSRKRNALNESENQDKSESSSDAKRKKINREASQRFRDNQKNKINKLERGIDKINRYMNNTETYILNNFRLLYQPPFILEEPGSKEYSHTIKRIVSWAFLQLKSSSLIPLPPHVSNNNEKKSDEQISIIESNSFQLNNELEKIAGQLRNDNKQVHEDKNLDDKEKKNKINEIKNSYKNKEKKIRNKFSAKKSRFQKKNLIITAESKFQQLKKLHGWIKGAVETNRDLLVQNQLQLVTKINGQQSWSLIDMVIQNAVYKYLSLSGMV